MHAKKIESRLSAPAESWHPNRVALLTARSCNLCKVCLESFHIGSIDHMLRKIVIYIGHREDRPIEQCIVRRNLYPMTVEHLVVLGPGIFGKSLRIPRQKTSYDGWHLPTTRLWSIPRTAISRLSFDAAKLNSKNACSGKIPSSRRKPFWAWSIFSNSELAAWK